MSSLYVINCTRQHHVFHFRVPENLNLLERHIPPLSQLKVFEGSQVEVEYIVSQHEHYGMIEFSKAIYHKGYNGIMYSNQQVDFNNISQLDETNREELDAIASKERENMTAATALKNEELMKASGIPSNTTLEVIEKGTKGNKDAPVQTLSTRQSPKDFFNRNTR